MSPPWEDVPYPVKRAVCAELGMSVGEIDIDAPDFYGEEM
jgi:hypothetical protein